MVFMLDSPQCLRARIRYPSTFSYDRRRFNLKTTNSPKNPDFYDRTGNLEIVRRRSAFLTLIIENHFFSLTSEHPQQGSFERVASRNCDRCWHGRAGIDNDKMIGHIKV